MLITSITKGHTNKYLLPLIAIKRRSLSVEHEMNRETKKKACVQPGHAHETIK